MTAATTTEAAPFSVEEMRELISRLGPITGLEYARAIATAAALERVTKWILERDAERTLTPERERVREAFCGLIARDAAVDRDAGKAPIPALETVREALADPSDYYDGNACMEACRLACRGRSGIEAHLVASAIQYLWRSGRKGPALPDLLKAKDMIERLVRLVPEPVAAARLVDGSQVVAFAPAGLEARAFTAEDLDERGMPRWKP